jgi:hypothetical protein
MSEIKHVVSHYFECSTQALLLYWATYCKMKPTIAALFGVIAMAVHQTTQA